ncbi:MAG: GH1 family beta-glucosidase, partial [Chloroflexota bacterium]|nr:GH1 family beta-glucosidase [Chloroflexota bacterium]
MRELTAVFPEGFVWGAATAAYQVEGAAYEDGRGESIWDRFSHTPGKTKNGDTGDVACDHYHRWRGDIALLGELGLHAHRFSVSWPRILPLGRGRPLDAGLDFYDQLVDGLLEVGITPWATLYHWDLPQVLEDQGGWPSRGTVEAFAAFADIVSRRLGDRVQHWVTLNEPWSSAFLGYRTGHHAPGRTSSKDALQATHSLLLAHGNAVPVIRSNAARAQVGIVLSPSQIYPATDGVEDRAAAQRFDGLYNRWFLDPLYSRGYPEGTLALYGDDAPRTRISDFPLIAVETDFLGVNCRSPIFVRDAEENAPLRIARVRKEGNSTAMDRLRHARGVYDLLQRLHAAYPTGPIYISGNVPEYPDALPSVGRIQERERILDFARQLTGCAEALADGVPLRGYFAEPLLDGFEWAFGYSRH